MNLLHRLHPSADDVSIFPKVAAKVRAAQQGDAEKHVKRLKARLEEQKGRKRRLLNSMLDGTVTSADYTEANEDFERAIAGSEKELLTITPQQEIQDAFIRFAKIHLRDVAGAWQLATPEQRGRVQNLLFDRGLPYSSDYGILNRSKSCLFSSLEVVNCSEILLASPTGFEPVLPP
ncbi:MAG TPA: hypothetical protein VGB94_11975 [Acidobacteriaceae bacterium]